MPRAPAPPAGPSRSHQAAPGPQPAPREPHEITYGLRAALAVFERRRDEIVAITHGRDLPPDAAQILRAAAMRMIPCHEVGSQELERLAGSTHHEGLCVAARPRRWVPPVELADLLVKSGGVAVALDRVRNPYNVGAVLRGAAFFGSSGAILGAPAPHPALAPDAIRVAEGGVEHLALCRTTDLADTLGRLRFRGVHVIGADGASSVEAIGHRFPRPLVLVVGHEREGMGPRVRAQCEAVVAIRGSGAVESLNVAVATGVLIAEAMRGR